ncbi:MULTISPECIES: sucrase ferredoxin [Corynebacterium]|uniref:sucrase ferredoxin n=1 Tax=Corynebacterium TaxID=1716 RepID=UPI0003B89C4D|nr:MULTISPECIES: sucrase ferredoxin [Corynebacterium]ERS39601.1 hypothetical protein HMPREF1292_01061 [Corynebacterium sp. KPL1995]ERS73067.1 hypothetical protein HMPREF1290_01064 [Corynebacterium sp. KPL1989]MDK4304120.1 sucrase ferredoxin [Corynebacterium pseudodiphtheriticum]MDK8805238.1 sucrase ferredoxin [Corynebacterium pseudodiphtheriticum]RUP89746.1 sucrase ferredoxin [Corynebacterium pseudodiphtheriticum]
MTEPESRNHNPRCSDVQIEPLPGTAKRDRMYVVFEWPAGWSHDVLDGDTFGAELSKKIKEHLGSGVGFQLIRKPGRAGHQMPRQHRVYLVYPEQAYTELLYIGGPEDILQLDLAGPGNNKQFAARPSRDPLLLVCTHAKRDVCCAVKGRPLAAYLETKSSTGDVVWETSHTKGHRFAPAMLLLPWGYSFGRLNEQAGGELLQAALEGKYFHPANRGRGIYDEPSQAAEVAVAGELLAAGEYLSYQDLVYARQVAERATGAPGESSGTGGPGADSRVVEVAHRDGRTWRVALEQQLFDGVVASCGKNPATKPGWAVTDLAAS